MTALALADRRLRYLYEISTLLTRFAGIDETLPRVVDVAARALPIRTAALVLDTNAGLHSHVWKTSAVTTESMDAALAHAHASYSWFAAGSALVDRVKPPPSVRRLPPTASSSIEADASFAPRPYVVLPLVVRRAHVFGALQVESTAVLAEADVLFLDAVANQVAVAIDRQLAIDGAEARVRAQLDFTRAITGSLGEGVVATDLDGCISFMNPAAEQILGWPEGDVVGKPVEEVLRVRRAEANDHEEVVCPLLRALAMRHRIVSDDHAFVDADGRAIPVSYIAAPIGSSHQCTGAVLAFREVLAVKRAERAQRLLAACSAALGESLDPKTMLGALVQCVVPLFADACFIDLMDGDESTARVAFAAATGNDVDAPPAAELVVPLRGRGRSFGRLTFAMAAERMHSAADFAVAEEIARRTGIALENARLHAQTEKAVRDRQEILALVSHDLRSPLHTIVMAVGAIRDRARPAELHGEDVRTIDIIARAASRMARMTRDLLDVSSIDANTLAIDPKPTRVAAILVDLLEALQATATSRSLDLSVTQSDPTLIASCDHDRILQVLTNLVGNAIKFTPPEGQIDVAVEPDGDVIRFVVCDTGSGIAADLVAHVFDRHRQAAETASQGRGLGLFITKGIVEAHGGRIRVDSEPGVGTAFEFCLPRVVGRPVVKTAPMDASSHAASTGDRVGQG